MNNLEVRPLLLAAIVVLLVLITTIDHLGTTTAGQENLTGVLVVLALLTTIAWVIIGLAQQAQRR
jgi:hypothetical protein